MAQEPVLRRLSAILAADVVGYSRLMGTDEVGTLAALKGRRKDVLEPLVAQYRGRIFKVAGDAVLIEFASPVNAVQCAVDLQGRMAGLNQDLPADRQINLRIGINLGDIMVEGSDLYGDGVNIAARLEGIAEPGGILVSESAHGHVANKVSVAFEDLGAQNLKNIANPVRVYRVATTGSANPPFASAQAPRPSEKISIAVLPFDNMSGDPEQGYFSDGITEDIITELSRFGELLIIARNSSFQFRGQSIGVTEVGKKLGVQFIVEGSVRKIGNRVRVTAQLVDAVSAAHIWAERYDRDLIDIFEIQDEITRTVVARVVGQARSSAANRIRSRPTESLSAYDCFLRALGYFSSETSTLQAEPLLRKAIELDPNFADAHALLCILHTTKYFLDDRIEHLDAALKIGQRALELDPAGPRANNAVGFALIYLHRMDEAGHYLKHAIALNPNESAFRGDYANWLKYMGDTEGAFREIDEAQRRDPYATDWFWSVRGQIEAVAGRHTEALISFHRLKSQTPTSHCYQAICHLALGQGADAKEQLALFKAAVPDIRPTVFFASMSFADAATLNRLMEALRQAEATDGNR